MPLEPFAEWNLLIKLPTSQLCKLAGQCVWERRDVTGPSSHIASNYQRSHEHEWKDYNKDGGSLSSIPLSKRSCAAALWSSEPCGYACLLYWIQHSAYSASQVIVAASKSHSKDTSRFRSSHLNVASAVMKPGGNYSCFKQPAVVTKNMN